MELLHTCVRRTLPWHDEAAVEAHTCSSNNYAVVNLPELKPASDSHVKANKIEKLRRQRALYDRLRLPPEVAWAGPSAAAVAELLREMRLK